MLKSFIAAYILSVCLVAVSGCKQPELPPMEITNETSAIEKVRPAEEPGYGVMVDLDETGYEYRRLKGVSYFSPIPKGLLNEYSEELAALNNIMLKKDALQLLYKLEANATYEGKLFALCGLYYMDNEGCMNLADKYLQSEEEVMFFTGCVGTYEPMSEMVLGIKSGQFAQLAVYEYIKEQVISGAERDYLCVKDISDFCGEGVEQSVAAPSVNRLMLEENALEIFNKLEANATNAGRLHALCGLYYLNPENFSEKIKNYYGNKNVVRIWPNYNYITLDELAEDFANGYYPSLIVWESTREQLNLQT